MTGFAFAIFTREPLAPKPGQSIEVVARAIEEQWPVHDVPGVGLVALKPWRPTYMVPAPELPPDLGMRWP